MLSNEAAEVVARKLRTQHDDLLKRLRRGERKVEEAKATDDPRADAWEDLWIRYLHEYEGVCDKLVAMGEAL